MGITTWQFISELIGCKYKMAEALVTAEGIKVAAAVASSVSAVDRMVAGYNVTCDIELQNITEYVSSIYGANYAPEPEAGSEGEGHIKQRFWLVLRMNSLESPYSSTNQNSPYWVNMIFIYLIMMSFDLYGSVRLLFQCMYRPVLTHNRDRT